MKTTPYDTETVIEYIKSYFASKHWKPRSGEKVVKIENLSDIIYVHFERGDAVCISPRGASVIEHLDSEDLKPVTDYSYDKKITSSEDGLRQAMIAIKAWQNKRDDFYNECLEILTSSGISLKEAIRMNANVFGDFKA